MYDWIQRSDGENELNMFIGKAEASESALDQLVLVVSSLCALIAYVAYFTVLKFQRIEKEAEEYIKI